MRTVLTVLLVAVASAGMGGWLGYRVAYSMVWESAMAEMRTAQLSTQYAVEATREEQHRAAEAAYQRGLQSAAGREVVINAASDPVPGCLWTDVERLRVDSLYRIYGAGAD